MPFVVLSSPTLLTTPGEDRFLLSKISYHFPAVRLTTAGLPLLLWQCNFTPSVEDPLTISVKVPHARLNQPFLGMNLMSTLISIGSDTGAG